MKLSVSRSNKVLHEIELDVGEGTDITFQEFIIGRAKDCHIVLDNQQISRQHAVLRFNEGVWEVEKMSSLGVVTINGSPEEKIELMKGDIVGIGPFTLALELPDSSSTQDPQPKNKTTEESENDAQEEVSEEDEFDAGGETGELDLNADAAEVRDDMDLDFGGDKTGENIEGELSGEEAETEQAEENEMDSDGEVNFDDTNASDDGFDDGFGDPGDDGGFGGELEEMGGAGESTQFINAFAEFFLDIEGGKPNFNKFKVEDAETFIGRDAEKCKIVLDDSEVSGVHAKITKTNVFCMLEDLGSSNGTLLNGEKINKATLNTGDEFVIGGSTFKFKVRSELLENEADSLMPVEESQMVESEFGGEVSVGAFDDGAVAGAAAASAPAAGNDKSLVGKFKRWWGGLNPRQKIIYAVVFVGAILFLDTGEETKPPAKGKEETTKTDGKKGDKKEGEEEKTADKKNALKPGEENTKWMIRNKQKQRELNEAEINKLESTYLLAKTLYEQRKYAETLFELEKIFRITEEYRGAVNLKYAAEQKLAELEELERKKRLEQERKERQERVKRIVEKLKEAVKEKNVRLAENLITQILELDPENIEVQEQKLIITAYKEEQIRIAEEKAAREAERKRQLGLLQPGKTLYIKKEWYKAIIKLEEFLRNENMDEDLIKEASEMLVDSKKKLANIVEPLVGKARSLKEGQDLKASYQTFSEVLKVEPSNPEALNEISTISRVLETRAKNVYREALINESLSLFEEAKEKFQEVMQISPTDSKYFQKAKKKLRRYGQ